MVKPFLQVASVVATLALAVPAVAAGQAIPRTSSGGSSSGSSGGGSSSGGGGGAVTSSGGSGVSQPPSGSGSGSGRTDPGHSTLSSGSPSGRSASRAAATQPTRTRAGVSTAPGGVVASHSSPSGFSSSTSSSSLNRAVFATGSQPGEGGASGRSKGNKPAVGTATPRPPLSGGDLIGFPFYGSWGPYYPWYSAGFGWGAYYYGYSPWLYAGTCWGWGAYGPWYDPFGYCYAPYWGDPGFYDYGGGGGSAKPAPTTGKLRLRVNPDTAKVYIDGGLVGTVDEFNGLSDHLELEGGHHELKLVADGYATYTGDVSVEIDHTKTIRVSLKKK
ncbi:MAG TPA: PEGA domain-containing protein [Vicinamibacterales bacterium]|nr:PEGA domain-containing protein [Vicinamibacterales bacterium]